MEYFDWLAGCTDKELFTLAETYSIKVLPASYPDPLTPRQRDAMGRALWSMM